jgi:hypothetical protein
MRKAINAKCKDCIFDPVAGGNWRQQVEACTTPECSLYALRPVSEASRTGDTTELSTRCERGQDGATANTGSEAHE